MKLVLVLVLGQTEDHLDFSIKENNWLGKGMQVSANADVSQDSLRGSLSFTDTNYNFTGKSLPIISKILKTINQTLDMKIL